MNSKVTAHLLPPPKPPHSPALAWPAGYFYVQDGLRAQGLLPRSSPAHCSNPRIFFNCGNGVQILYNYNIFPFVRDLNNYLPPLTCIWRIDLTSAFIMGLVNSLRCYMYFLIGMYGTRKCLQLQKWKNLFSTLLFIVHKKRKPWNHTSE